MSNTENANENEVSLINLFFFILKYRKFIVFGTGICTLLAVLWIFVFPKIFPTVFKSSDTYNVSYTVSSVNPPSCVLRELGNNISVAALSQSRMKQEKFVMAQNKINPVFGGQDKEGYDYNNFIKGEIIERNFKFGPIIVGTEFEVSCDLEEKDFALFDKFVKGCVDDTNRNLENYIFPVMDTINTDDHPEILSYKNSYKSLITLEEKPLILKNNKANGPVKKLFIAFIISFIFFFMIAFIKNDYEKIKSDDFLSAKFSSAWNEGKFKKNK